MGKFAPKSSLFEVYPSEVDGDRPDAKDLASRGDEMRLDLVGAIVSPLDDSSFEKVLYMLRSVGHRQPDPQSDLLDRERLAFQ